MPSGEAHMNFHLRKKHQAERPRKFNWTQMAGIYAVANIIGIAIGYADAQTGEYCKLGVTDMGSAFSYTFGSLNNSAQKDARFPFLATIALAPGTAIGTILGYEMPPDEVRCPVRPNAESKAADSNNLSGAAP